MTHPQRIQAICCSVRVALCQRTAALPGQPRGAARRRDKWIVVWESGEGPDGAQNGGDEPRDRVWL